jgi:hypothetical protein
MEVCPVGDTTATETSSLTLDFTALLLGTLGFTDGEFVSLAYEDAAGVFHTAVMEPADAIAAAAKIPATANAYFGINPVRGPARTHCGRGTEADVTRLAALWVDLDVKDGGCPDLGAVDAIVGDLSGILGTRPSATVDSGHGRHAYWEISDGQVSGGDIGPVRAALKREGRLAAVVADKRGAAVDNVFDLARMMRIPGSFNNKIRGNGADPLPVTGHPDIGGPLTMAEVDERLAEVGILEEPGDTGTDDQPLSDPAGWEFATHTCDYVAAILANLPTDGPPPPEKAKKGRGRHQWAASQAVKLTCARRLGCISETDWDSAQNVLRQRLTELRAVTGQTVPRHEIGGLFKLGQQRTAAKTEEQCRAELGGHTHDAGAYSMGAPDASDDDRAFWSQTDELKHIHAFARSRGASPYATLGTVLRRTTGCIEPYVVLPPIVGGQVSLNLFTAPVGSSGVGKDIANAAGHDAVDFYISIGSALLAADEAVYIHPGTGEGLARIFAGRGNQPGETRAHLQVPDVATLEALAGRKGQTLVSQLLAAYMGQPIGFSNNAKETTTAVGAHSYRLSLSVGVQPENADFFLSRENHGFPQRFLWLPTTDPHAPLERPHPIDPRSVELPQFTLADGAQRYEIGIPGAVAEEIWSHRWRVLTGTAGVDPLDAHIKLTQLKVAAAVAILHGDTRVTDEAWGIAGHLIDVSAKVHASLAAAVEARRHRENTAKAHDQADRQAIVEVLLADKHQRRVRKAIERKLKRVGTAAEYELEKACHSSIRDDFKSVFDLCLDERFIVCCEEGDEDHAARYRLG